MIKGGLKETKISIKTHADDNNQAELLAIYYGIKHAKTMPEKETLCIITDSKVAIDCLTDNPNPKYERVINLINKELDGSSWRIYHCKGHSRKGNRYTTRQAMTDHLAKRGRER